jgi:opacity protein-like surface antigen
MTSFRGSILVFLCACYLGAQAQGDVPKQQITGRSMAVEFSAGYSVAMGKYRSLDMEEDKAGYAVNGWQLQAAFNWMGSKDFGLSLLYTFQRNPLNDSTGSIRPDGWHTGTLGPGAWSNHYLLAGPVFMKTIRKLYIDARILGGLIVSASPVFTTPNPGDTTGMDMDKNMGTGFAYLVSAGIGYAFTPRLAVKFSVNLRGGWPGKEKQYPAILLGYRYYRDPETGILVSEPVYSAAADYEIKKVVTTLDPSIGLVYRF